MINLIKNELIKIFKKKSIYITLLVILAFVILTNCIYKFAFQSNYSFATYADEYVQYMKEELTKLDPEKPSDTQIYIQYKSQIELIDTMKQYSDDSWQQTVASNILSSYISEKNTYMYGEMKDSQKVAEMQSKIDTLIAKLDSDDWKFFANDEVKEKKETLQNLEQQKKNTEDKQKLQNIESSIQDTQIDLEVAEYRVEKNIKYGNDYMNRALENYQSSSKSLLMLEQNKTEEKYSDKKEKNENIKIKEISKYILENNVDLYKNNDIRAILSDIFSEYGLFIIVFIVMIAGTIVSEEFNKGTIKLLLVKPYTRNKLLLAKFITFL